MFQPVINDFGCLSFMIDFDGKIDKGGYLGKGFEKPVEKINGVFILKRATGETRISESTKDIFNFPDTVLSDINSMLP